jgi:hypothetical protein|tara:strand:+ start:2333 stop:2572 length:240 start_codon:yes stop_codon:yes gene_type:complete
MYIRRLIHGPVGRVVIPVLLGLGLATLFRKVCKDRSCLIFHAAPLDKIKNQIFKYNDKCYKFEEFAKTCDPTKKTLVFA